MALEEHAKIEVEAWQRLQDLPPPLPFPEKGMSEKEVLRLVQSRLERNIPSERNWNSFTGHPPHPIAVKAFNMAINTNPMGFLKEIFPATYEMGQEAVRMIGSLLGASDPAGFLTSGGTESNCTGIRLARNLRRKDRPEIVVPSTAHYSFKLAGELFGLKVRVAGVNSDLSPKMDEVEKLVNENTVALACTTPEGRLGKIDPVSEFGELAEKYGLSLHVDAAIGGFILPFMRELGHKIPPFDFSVPRVTSMTADPYKLGLALIPVSGFIIRDRSYLDAIPVEEVLIPTLNATGRGGATAIALWALLKHLGREGQKSYIKNALDITEMIAEEIRGTEGLELVVEPQITIVAFTSKKYDVMKINARMREKGWITSAGRFDHSDVKFMRIFVHPSKTKNMAEKLLEGLRKSVSDVKAST